MLSDDPGDIVHGELFALRARDELLGAFDMYEACGEGFEPPTEYVRKMLSVTLADGSVSDAWTYLYNWPVARLPQIASGRFSKTRSNTGVAAIRAQASPIPPMATP